jgi:hypothetical protein
MRNKQEYMYCNKKSDPEQYTEQDCMYIQYTYFYFISFVRFLLKKTYIYHIHDKLVLPRDIQLTLVQRFYQLYFLIHYCCDNTRKVRTGAPHMYWLHEK